MSKRTKPHVELCVCGDHAFAAIGPQHVALVSVEDSDLLAAFSWNAFCPHKTRVVDRRKHVYYASRSTRVNGKRRTVLLHREITGVLDQPTVIIDHQEHNGLDCRRSNLRPGTQAQNRGNSRLNINNASGFKGVCRFRGRWKAYIGTAPYGGGYYLGLYDTPEDAARAYNEAAVERYGEHALLNVLPEAAE